MLGTAPALKIKRLMRSGHQPQKPMVKEAKLSGTDHNIV